MQRNSQIPCAKKQALQAKAVLEQLKNDPSLMGQRGDFSQPMSADVTETFCQRNFCARRECRDICWVFISPQDFEKTVEEILVQQQCFGIVSLEVFSKRHGGGCPRRNCAPQKIGGLEIVLLRKSCNVFCQFLFKDST